MAARPSTAYVVDVSALPPDLATIDALARLALAARRRGRRMRLRGADDELRRLIGFTGLAGVLRLESEREPEQREERLRVEEERELGDPPA
jgi:anti-anti-sigma regulatory factor